MGVVSHFFVWMVQWMVSPGIADRGPNSTSVLQNELLPYNPVANPKSIFWSRDKQVRFTVLTDCLVRIEYSGHTDDSATLAVVNRYVDNPPKVEVDRTADGGTVISTARIEIYYKECARVGGPCDSLSRSTLQVANKVSGHTYRFGDPMDEGNLFGTIRTLDTLGPTNLNCSTFPDPGSAHCEWGLVSLSGWALLNETDAPRIGGAEDWWLETEPNSKYQDLYLFMHGLDYKTAVADYSIIGGKVALHPRYTLGVMWTRWYDYDAKNIEEVLSTGFGNKWPIDVFVLDMNWHKKPWWGGYALDERIIDGSVFAQLHDRFKVHVGMNVHDCLLSEDGCPSGTLSVDDGQFYWDYLERVGGSPEQPPERDELMPVNSFTNPPIPLDLLNVTRALAKEDAVFQYFEKNDFCDLWWIDWQQGEASGNLSGNKQNPTIWINKLRYTNRARWDINKRGSVLSRFGGLGSHRYGLGFSGDVQMLDWENLSYQPFFTSTAANVLFSSWSHDITAQIRDPELLVRWTQWGVYSPVVRFHERGMSSGPCAFNSFPVPDKECANVDLWGSLPVRFADALRKALLEREELVPYLYTQSRNTFDTGVPWFRPLYYDHPEWAQAYTYKNQYLFGDDIMVSPIVGQSATALTPSCTEWELAVPPKSKWYLLSDGIVLEGGDSGRRFKKYFDLAEVPVMVKAGVVMVKRNLANASLYGLAASNFTDLVIDVIPGASRGSTFVYEDDGVTLEYLGKEYTKSGLQVDYLWMDPNGKSRLQVRLESHGPYSQSVAHRHICVRVRDVGGFVSSAEFLQKNYNNSRNITVSYDGYNVWSEVCFEWDIDRDDDTSKSVSVEIIMSLPNLDLSGVRGGIAHARYAKAALDEAALTPGTHPCWHSAPCGFQPQDNNLLLVASVGRRLERAANAKNSTLFSTFIDEFLAAYHETVFREITVENVLRTDNTWAPQQGGWPEATRMRANYAVAMVQSAMGPLCSRIKKGEMALVCKEFYEGTKMGSPQQPLPKPVTPWYKWMLQQSSEKIFEPESNVHTL